MRTPKHPLLSAHRYDRPRNDEPLVETDFRDLVDSLPHLILITNADGDPLTCNLAWRRFAAQNVTRDSGGRWLDLVHPEDADAASAIWQQCLVTGTPSRLECRLLHRSGQYRWVLAVLHNRCDEAGETRGWVITFTDVHERAAGARELTRRLWLRNSMLDASTDGIEFIGTDGCLRYVNDSGRAALGIPKSDGRKPPKWIDLFPRAMQRQGRRALKAAQAGKTARFASTGVAADGKPQYWDNLLTPMVSEAGTSVGVLCISRDVSLQRRAESRLRVASELDGLTGLINRRTFTSEIKKAIARCRDTGVNVGLMIADLDHFKHVNDALGHAAGDHLLRTLSRRFRACMPKNGVVARLGGDEFAFVIRDAVSEADVLEVAARVVQQVRLTIALRGQVITSGISLGCAMFPRDARDVTRLMKCADTALQAIKTSGRGGIRIFHSNMLDAASVSTGQLERAREIIRDGAVRAYYLPRVGLSDASIAGFQAVLRWHYGAHDAPQVPATIFDAFKDYDLAIKLADAMQRQVLGDLSNWLKDGLTPCTIAINAGPVEFIRDDYAEHLLKRMAEFNVPPSSIEVTVPERALAERGSELVIRALTKLKAAGLRVALDDFGTGTCALTRLKCYPVDSLKISAELVGDMIDEPFTRAVANAISNLGASLSLDVVADGISSDHQRTFLIGLGCRTGQGDLFGGALTADDAAQLLMGVRDLSDSSAQERDRGEDGSQRRA